MAFKKRWFKKREEILKGTGYDSLLEKKMHETVLSDCEFHPKTKYHYSVPHTYEVDFRYEKDGKVFLLETKGRFRDSAEARKYQFIREYLPDNHELVFIMEKRNTKFPFAKKRKDGTYMTHEEYLEKHGFRVFHQDDFILDKLFISTVVNDSVVGRLHNDGEFSVEFV